MSRRAAIIYVLTVIVLGAIILLPDDRENDSGTTPSVPLDYSKPVFTTATTVVCPLSLLSDVRADHSPDKVVDMVYSIFSRTEKAEALGCQELQPGILVSTSPLAEEFVNVRLPGELETRWFTLAGELTNKIADRYDVERKQPSEPHASWTKNEPATIPATAASSAGHLLVSIPAQVPIPTGDGIATDMNGWGALICPDEEHMAAAADIELDISRKETPADQADEYRTLGCENVAAGTEMTSLGATEHGSLAIVTAKLADGTLLQGVTFPSMFIKTSVSHGERAVE